MTKEHESPGRADGGQLETRQKLESDPSSQESFLALGLIAENDFGVLHNLLNAAELGLETYLLETPETDASIMRVARRLDATIGSPPIEEPSQQDFQNYALHVRASRISPRYHHSRRRHHAH